MVKISDYLQDLVQQTNKGTCKACGTAVLWSQKRLASHKRTNCPQASPEERRLFLHQKIVPATSILNKSDNSINVKNIPVDIFPISDYLENFEKVTKKGKYKSCSASVPWSRERVASHKRSTCTNATAEEKYRVSKKKFFEAHDEDLSTHSQKVIIFDKSCYLCRNVLEALRSPLDNFLKFTKTPVYQYLGKQASPL